MDQADLAEVGTDLSNRIAEFERRIGALKKKCAHRVNGEGGDDGLSWGLGLKRHSGEWRLFYVRFGTEYHQSEKRRQQYLFDGFGSSYEPVQVDKWTLLSDVSLDRKARAVGLFPKFLAEVRAEYERRAALVQEAHKELDTFDACLRQAEEEDA